MRLAAGRAQRGEFEPIIPDAIGSGKAPFIKPFMVAMADDHYALDVRRARDLLRLGAAAPAEG